MKDTAKIGETGRFFMVQTQWTRLAGCALAVVSCGGATETTSAAGDGATPVGTTLLGTTLLGTTTPAGTTWAGTAQTSSALAGACTSGTTSTGFVRGALGPQAGTFNVDFDATPTSSGSDAIVGLSNGAPANYAALGAIVRFNPAGMIDVRNGAAYGADVAVPYAGGTVYHFRMSVDIVSHTYSVYEGFYPFAQTLLATNYAFRTEQAHVSKLDSYAVKVDAGAGLNVCNVAVSNVCDTAVPGSGFLNRGFPAEAKFLTATFTAKPSANGIDGVIGLSAQAAGAFNDLGAAVRFNDAGMIDVRKGDAYAADTAFGYVKDQVYTFQVITDVGFHSYSVVVNDQIVLARNFAFRTQQASVPSLANVAVVMDSPVGAVTLCDIAVSSLPHQALYVHDVLTLASHGVVLATGGAVDPSGATYTSSRSPTVLVLSKLAQGGTPVIWSRSLPISGGVQLNFVGGGGDGRTAVVGGLDGRIDFGGAGNLYASSGENGAQAFVARLDSNGRFVDGGIGTLSIIRSVVVDSHTNAYLSGYRVNPDRFLLNAFLDGSIQEWGPILVPPRFLGSGSDVAVDSSGNVTWTFTPRIDNGGGLGFAVKFAPLTSLL